MSDLDKRIARNTYYRNGIGGLTSNNTQDAIDELATRTANIGGSVNNYSDLAPLSVDVGTLYIVLNDTGSRWLLNFKSRGIYIYTGSTWESYTQYIRYAMVSNQIESLWQTATDAGTSIYPKYTIINYEGNLYQNLTGVNTDTEPDIDTTNWRNVVITVSDTNSIDLTITDNNIKGDIKYQNSTTIDLSVDSNGIKADLNSTLKSTYDGYATGKEDADATILKQSDVINTLISASTIYPLSANQGKTLKDSLDTLTTIVSALETSYSRRKSVIDIVDNTQAPPTEVTGDRYILDNTGVSHADWDGAAGNDLVEFNGTTWDAVTPEEGYVSYVDNEDKDALFVDDGTPQWELRNTGVINHNDLSSIQGGTTNEYYHLTSAQHTIVTQAATTSLSGYLTSTDWNTFNGKEPAITTLSIAKGGTNSSTALNNNRVMISSSNAIVESAITTTELGYIDGLDQYLTTTSNVQHSKLGLGIAPNAEGLFQVSKNNSEVESSGNYHVSLTQSSDGDVILSYLVTGSRYYEGIDNSDSDMHKFAYTTATPSWATDTFMIRDGANKRIGFGDGHPDYQVDINHPTTPVLAITRTGTDAGNSYLLFRSDYAGLLESNHVTAQIIAAPANTGGRLLFYTSSNAGALNEAFRLDENQRPYFYGARQLSSDPGEELYEIWVDTNDNTLKMTTSVVA